MLLSVEGMSRVLEAISFIHSMAGGDGGERRERKRKGGEREMNTKVFSDDQQHRRQVLAVQKVLVCVLSIF